jgi:hypothetical protein
MLTTVVVIPSPFLFPPHEQVITAAVRGAAVVLVVAVMLVQHSENLKE